MLVGSSSAMPPSSTSRGVKYSVCSSSNWTTLVTIPTRIVERILDSHISSGLSDIKNMILLQSVFMAQKHTIEIIYKKRF